VLTNDRLGYDGSQCAVALLRSDVVQVDLFHAGGMDAGERRTGRALGEALRRGRFAGDPNLLLMYESVRSFGATGPTLNMGAALLDGIDETLGGWPRTVGMGLFAETAWRPSLQYVDDRLESQSAVAVALSGELRMDTVSMHGLRPMSSYRTVTRTDGQAVLEIDGRPALEAIEDLLGPTADQRWEDYPLHLTLGANTGDKFGEFREEDYAICLCFAIDRARRALIMFDDVLRPGMEVQLMRRQLDFAEVRRRAEALLARASQGRTPFFALYIDCAGRAAHYAGTESEEAEQVQAALAGLPLLGVYSGNEIAPFGARVQRVNHTGVLSVLSA
jgi:small ligand-binding sensory domain FIST